MTWTDSISSVENARTAGGGFEHVTRHTASSFGASITGSISVALCYSVVPYRIHTTDGAYRSLATLSCADRLYASSACVVVRHIFQPLSCLCGTALRSRKKQATMTGDGGNVKLVHTVHIQTSDDRVPCSTNVRATAGTAAAAVVIHKVNCSCPIGVYSVKRCSTFLLSTNGTPPTITVSCRTRFFAT